MTTWMYRLIGVVMLLAIFNMVRFANINPVIDIGFMIFTIPIATALIVGEK